MPTTFSVVSTLYGVDIITFNIMRIVDLLWVLTDISSLDTSEITLTLNE
jgi:hypothetical protein